MQTTASPKNKSKKKGMPESTRISIQLSGGECISGTMLRQSDKGCTVSFESKPALTQGQQVEIDCGRTKRTSCCTRIRDERGSIQADFDYTGGKN